MKDNFDAEPGPPGRRDDPLREQPRTEPEYALAARPAEVQSDGHSGGKRLDGWAAMDLLAQRWIWLMLGALAGGAAFFFLGQRVVQVKYTASAQLMRYDISTGPNSLFKNNLSAETFAALIRSPDLLRRVGEQANPPIPPEKLIKCIKVEPEADSDMVKVLLAARTPQQAVDLLNIYTREAVEFAKDFQKNQAATLANDYLKKQTAKIENVLAGLHNELRGLPAAQGTNKTPGASGAGVAGQNPGLGRVQSLQMMKLRQQLEAEYDKLNDLSRKYTDLNPLVEAERQVISDLERQIAKAATNAPAPGTDISLPNDVRLALQSPISGLRPGEAVFNPEADIFRMKSLALEESHVQLVNRLDEAQLYATNPPGMARVFAPATMKTVKENMRGLKISLTAGFGGVAGFGGTLLLVFLVELMGRRLRTADDLRRVTKLPVLTTLPDLHRMEPQERAQWAFRTWTMLQGRLSRSANHGLVCGITSSREGEGRSTWVNLLAEAASLTGFRVLTIATTPPPAQGAAEEEEEGIPLKDAQHNHSNPQWALSSNVLTSPAQVTDQLVGPNSRPVVHIPLPGWVWNLERRKQWREALNHWRKIENLVILVELPPAGVTEAVLLGCNLPNLLWLAESGTPDAAETRAQLETLRHARCNLVGAVLNRHSGRTVKNKFPRWVETGAVTMVLATGSLWAGEAKSSRPITTLAVAAPPPGAFAPLPSAPAARAEPQTNVSFSIVSPAQRGEWQRHLTLGPGDVLTLGFYGQPEFTRTEVQIAPDGMVNYLEATNVLATGLTIDELRGKLDQQLALYRRAPRTMITPVAFHSKKYYVLGKVMTKGVYTLDRPITVLEAIARAHGLENGLVDRNVIDLADFQRSFLMRGGKRYALNFEKLFQEGDLAQNIAIEPGDYLYFPASNVKEIYVVGEVRLPGPVTYTADTTIMAALSARGGYTDRAYKARVLVVRGSLNNPEPIAVDTHAILNGKAPDFKLQPKDIIYVNSRPFIRVEELADLAATAFIQSLITSWVGVDLVKPIQ